ncbi:hypothetical protein R6Q59_027000 [Mikania micrantha]
MSPETKNLAIIALFATILFLNFQENEAMRLLDGEFEETWMKRGNLLLSSLQQHSSVPSPGNGCNNTGNGVVDDSSGGRLRKWWWVAMEAVAVGDNSAIAVGGNAGGGWRWVVAVAVID